MDAIPSGPGAAKASIMAMQDWVRQDADDRRRNRHVAATLVVSRIEALASRLGGEVARASTEGATDGLLRLVH